MKIKLILFAILFPFLEFFAFILTWFIQAMYVLKMDNLNMPFEKLFFSYLLHPIYAVQECMKYKNPFIFILPIGAIILLIYLLNVDKIKASELDEKADIYGTAGWASIKSLTNKNLLGKSKFSVCSKKMFLNRFLESINEKK